MTFLETLRMQSFSCTPPVINLSMCRLPQDGLKVGQPTAPGWAQGGTTDCPGMDSMVGQPTATG